jgi:hypothetical protein
LACMVVSFLRAAIFSCVQGDLPTGWYIISSLTVQKSNELLSCKS